MIIIGSCERAGQDFPSLPIVSFGDSAAGFIPFFDNAVMAPNETAKRGLGPTLEPPDVGQMIQPRIAKFRPLVSERYRSQSIAAVPFVGARVSYYARSSS